MKSLLITPLVLLTLLAPLYAGADFEKGVQCIRDGDYCKVLKNKAENVRSMLAHLEFKVPLTLNFLATGIHLASSRTLSGQV